MGLITFARVDSRLIHGQIVTKWAKSSGASSIYIIDDELNSDPFSKEIMMASGKRYGFAVKVFSVAQALANWQANQFGKDKVFIIFKNVKTALNCIEQDLPITVLNLGGMPKKAGMTFYISNVALSEQELIDLRRIGKEKEIDIYAQTIPDEPRKKV